MKDINGLLIKVGKLICPGFRELSRLSHLFFVDDQGNLWVERTENEDHLFDVFTSEGYFLGQVTFPFSLESSQPIFRNGLLYAMTEDEFGAEMIVRARIEKF